MQKYIKGPGEADIPDVDFYIMKHGEEKQRRLLFIRAAIREKFPDATERIYYGIPTAQKEGKIILQYAAYKNHVSLLVGNILPAILKEQYPEFDYTDYTVVFPDNQPFPEDFVQKICDMGGQHTGEDFYAKCNRPIFGGKK